ncbi:MAG: hypothetical protein Q8N51_05850 [Gammaproteobacteria bacterium]|nr:hypothetical protein [Gammaproteobacteria bacterium]
MSISPTVWNSAEAIALNALNAFSNGDLTAHTVAGSRCVTVFAATTGKYYFELTTDTDMDVNLGVIGAQPSAATGPPGGPNGHGVALRSGNSYVLGGAPGATAYPGNIGPAVVVGVYIDFGAGTLGIVSNAGVQYPGILTGLNSTWAVTWGNDNEDSGMPTNPVTANFGATAFTHAVPSGYVSGYGAAIILPGILPALMLSGYGGGTAVSTLPSAMLSGYGAANGGVQLPRIACGGFGSFGVVGDLPSLVLRAFGGACGAATLPVLTVEAAGGGSAEMLLPSVLCSAVGHESTGEQAGHVILPMFALSAYSAGSAEVTLPTLLGAGAGVVENIGIAEMALPAITCESTGSAGGVGSASLTLADAYSLIGYSGAVISVTLTGGYAFTATGRAGSVCAARITLPMFELVAAGTQTFGHADMVLPALTMTPTGRAWLALPSLALVAVGTATVTATYEAYAINLKHSAEDATDEVTRYTNFPFTHIVRYQNSYFGANSTGLYLLEGTTDHATTPTAIPWAFRTAVTDFGYPEFKTVESACIGGRLGAAETLTLYAGEGKQTQAYAYTTPRGELAQNYRQKFGKGIRNHRYYALGANGSGELAIDTIGFNVVKLSRRI